MNTKIINEKINEIWSIVRENSLSIKALKESQQVTTLQINTLNKQIEELKDSQKKTDIQIQETAQQMKQTDIFLSNKFSELKEYVGNIGQNNGAVAESFFYETLANKMELGDFHFDFIEPNVKRANRKLNIQGEYDIVLYNSKLIVIIETKYKVHPNDIEKLLEKKIPNYRKLFPEKQNYTIYGAIAGLAFPDNVKEMALNQGLFVLTQGEGNIQVEQTHIQAF